MKDIINRIGTKNLIKMGIGAIIVIICIVGFSLLYYNFFYQKSYEEIEEIMVNAAKVYYSENKNELPKSPGDSLEIKTSTLAEGDYMKPISDYLKNEDIACKASVKVTNSNNKYRFNPLLDCGKYYKYEFITDHIKNTEPIVTTGNGLYQIGNEYVYRGENLNNNVSFAGINWQIIRIENDKLILIYNDRFDDVTVWDNRYNKTTESSDGINDYTISRIRDEFNQLYKKSNFINSNNKLLLTNYNLYIGKVGEEDNDISGTLAKTNILKNQYIGSLTVFDYMRASLDTNCNKANSYSCSNYNYLANYEYSYWTITADKNNTHRVFKFYTGEGLNTIVASTDSYIRPVIAITSDAIYVSGKGSTNNPYEFK